MNTPEITPTMSEETRQRIEQGLSDWANDGSEARQLFAAAQEKWNHALQPLEDAIIASERLTEEDFAIRINTRD